MAPMREHSGHSDAAGPLRRARRWAWLVFWVTAGSSVLYNCYHALVGEKMPWYTGVPEGFVPLLVAIGVLEFAGAWRKNIPLQAAAWLVTCGAMAWSAFATNSVVHQGWAFGLIADTAALSAMYFLLNGPTAQQAVDAVAAREAELTARAADAEAARAHAEEALRAGLDAARQAHEAALAKATAELGQAHEASVLDALTQAGREREEAERVAADAALSRAHAEMRHQLEVAGADHKSALDILSARLDAETRARTAAQREAARVPALEAAQEAARAELETAQAARAGAEQARAEAEQRAARAEAKVQRAARRTVPQAAPRTVPAASAPSVFEARKKAEEILEAEPDITGAALAERCGMKERWGQKRKEEWLAQRAAGGAEETGTD